MINDPVVEVTCDGVGCGSQVRTSHVIGDVGGYTGYTDYEAIERNIAHDGWITLNSKHYCEDCSDKLRVVIGE